MDEIRVAVSGAAGRMGATTCAAVAVDHELRLVAAIDPHLAAAADQAGGESQAEGSSLQGVAVFPDVEQALASGGIDAVIDFTVPAVVRGNVLTCVEHGIPTVVGTTGLSTDDLAEIGRACDERNTPVLIVPNFAMGAVMMMEFARRAAAVFDSCEIIELHHDRKLDAPSGTSSLTRQRIEEAWRDKGSEKEVPIHSVRLPGLVAHQEVIFGSLGETLTIRHDSLSRESFMPGVVLAVKRVRSLQGLVVGLENVL